jgi:Flp pilus assembly protein TadD
MRETRDRQTGGARRLVRGGLASIALGIVLTTAGCQMASQPADPAQTQAEIARGVSLLRAGQYENAYRQFSNMRPYSTRNPDALSGLAIASDLTGNRRQATKAYDALAEVVRNQAAFFNNRGYSRMLNGDLQEAYADLTRAASLAPDNAKIAGNLRMLRAILPRREQF